VAPRIGDPADRDLGGVNPTPGWAVGGLKDTRPERTALTSQNLQAQSVRPDEDDALQGSRVSSGSVASVLCRTYHHTNTCSMIPPL